MHAAQLGGDVPRERMHAAPSGNESGLSHMVGPSQAARKLVSPSPVQGKALHGHLGSDEFLRHSNLGPADYPVPEPRPADSRVRDMPPSMHSSSQNPGSSQGGGAPSGFQMGKIMPLSSAHGTAPPHSPSATSAQQQSGGTNQANAPKRWVGGGAGRPQAPPPAGQGGIQHAAQGQQTAQHSQQAQQQMQSPKQSAMMLNRHVQGFKDPGADPVPDRAGRGDRAAGDLPWEAGGDLRGNLTSKKRKAEDEGQAFGHAAPGGAAAQNAHQSAAEPHPRGSNIISLKGINTPTQRREVREVRVGGAGGVGAGGAAGGAAGVRRVQAQDHSAVQQGGVKRTRTLARVDEAGAELRTTTVTITGIHSDEGRGGWGGGGGRGRGNYQGGGGRGGGGRGRGY